MTCVPCFAVAQFSFTQLAADGSVNKAPSSGKPASIPSFNSRACQARLIKLKSWQLTWPLRRLSLSQAQRVQRSKKQLT